MGNSNSRRRAQTSAATATTTTTPVQDNFTGPTGLYPTCEWDQKIISRLILDKKLAPRFKGTQNEQDGTEECPICFLNYSSSNKVNCCNNSICTECYLQVKAPKGVSTCPFCNNSNFGVTFAPSKRQVSSTSVATPPSSPPSNSSSPLPLSTPSPTTESSKPASPLVMTAEERRQLEREMSIQRADHITSDQYAESRYRSSSWGSRNDGGMASARRNTFGPARSIPRRDRRDRESTRRSENLRTFEGRMRSIGLLDGDEDDHGYEPPSRGTPSRVPPGRYDESEARAPPREDHFDMSGNEGGMSLEQLEEMMLREAIRLSMSATATETPGAPPPVPGRAVAQPAPPMPEPIIQGTPNDHFEHLDFGDDEEAMLEYALTLSRQLSQPSNPAAPQTPTQELPNEEIQSSEIGITLSENQYQDRTLSPTALRLLDLIEEALSIPSPTTRDSDTNSSEVDGHQQRYGSYGGSSSDEGTI